MHPKKLFVVSILTGILIVSHAVPVSSQEIPSSREIIRLACDAAGTLESYSRLGTLRLEIAREEVTAGGDMTRSRQVRFVSTPGPLPGRFEMPQHELVAGDDGSGGWAIVRGQADPRPRTNYMVKRQIQTDMFPLFLPFSLTWDGVEVTGVSPSRYKGRDVWVLALEFERTFFSSPQISLQWSVIVDQADNRVIGAYSLATDLGHGLRADGMGFSWRKPTVIRGVTLPGEQRVVGIDETGTEKAHTRLETIAWSLIPSADAAKLFTSPQPRDPLISQQPPAVPGRPGTGPR